MKRRKLLFISLSLFMALALLEGALRLYFSIAGYHVGSLAPNWQQTKRVDTLLVQHNYYTDSTGIFRADSAYWAGEGIGIDQYGFRHITPPKADSVATKMLLLGDSFTWGSGAQPLDSSFANRLGQLGFEVYNTGIPGADPAQYALVADSFIPKVKPAITAVFFYIGNDIMDEYRTQKPYQNLYYITNTGWLPAYYGTQYFPTAQASYQFYLNQYSPKTWWGRLACHTAIGTLICSLPLRYRERQQWLQHKNNTFSNKYLQHIAAVCKQNNAQLMIFVIPYSGTDLGEAFYQNPKAFILNQYGASFKGLEANIYPLPIQPSDYWPLPNGHFNNQGHARAAQYILQQCSYPVFKH